MYYIKVREDKTEDPYAVVSGTFLMNTLPTRVLFDASATHSFSNPTTASRLACQLDDMDVKLYVTTLVRPMYQSELVVRNCPIVIQERVFLVDLVLLGIQGYDVIFGMDWLTKHRATIDCKQKAHILVTSDGERLVYQGSNPKRAILLISTTKACKLLKNGNSTYLC